MSIETTQLLGKPQQAVTWSKKEERDLSVYQKQTKKEDK
jgi:hypothetical protein